MRRRPPIVTWSTPIAVLALLLLAGCSAGAGTAASAAPPTTAVERKVTAAGDSISVGLGAALRDAVPAGVVVKVIGEEGSGLARPSRFDWPARLAQLAREFPPEVLVLSLGSNDAQDLRDGSDRVVARQADRQAWDTEYRRRLAAAFDAFAATGTTVVWVGHVHTADPAVGRANRHIHELAAAEAAARPFVVVADLAELLGTGAAPATRCLLPDGLHLSTSCLGEAATGLVPRLEPHLDPI